MQAKFLSDYLSPFENCGTFRIMDKICETRFLKEEFQFCAPFVCERKISLAKTI